MKLRPTSVDTHELLFRPGWQYSAATVAFVFVQAVNLVTMAHFDSTSQGGAFTSVVDATAGLLILLIVVTVAAMARAYARLENTTVTIRRIGSRSIDLATANVTVTRHMLTAVAPGVGRVRLPLVVPHSGVQSADALSALAAAIHPPATQPIAGREDQWRVAASLDALSRDPSLLRSMGRRLGIATWLFFAATVVTAATIALRVLV